MEENKNLSFEECILELEKILKNLEKPDISLEEAVASYTKGLELSKNCYSILSTNEELVVKKMTESGLVDFNKE
ncbi:MAG: exodeoxyribonuclease VII small subunit [Acholeplasmatales bacterium]|nr:exodeoxyribonuclease VII small subunit [Acholeplasmatales bacterium]